MIVATDNGAVQLLVAVAGGIPITRQMQSFIVGDDQADGALCVVLPRDGTDAVIAQRIAELLDAHGLATVPDTLEEDTA